MTHTDMMGRAAEEPPAGMLEYGTRVAIRDLIRLYGFEAARELIAQYLTEEADRKPRQ